MDERTLGRRNTAPAQSAELDLTSCHALHEACVTQAPRSDQRLGSRQRWR